MIGAVVFGAIGYIFAGLSAWAAYSTFGAWRRTTAGTFTELMCAIQFAFFAFIMLGIAYAVACLSRTA